MPMNQSQEYTLIPVKLTPTSEIIRHLRVKRYESETCPSERSIIIMNVPPLVSTSSLKRALSKVYGKISTVSFIDDTKSIFDTCYKIQHNSAAITFTNKTSIDKILATQNSQDAIPLTSEDADGKIDNFMQIYRQNYNKSIISLDEESCERVNKLVDSYEQFIAKREKKVKEMNKNEADDEGWITVKHKGRHNLNKDKAMTFKDRLKAMKKKRIESSISAAYQYRMRTKEEKYARLRELRARFEEDKFKLAQMKTGRKFKPM